MDKKNLAVTRQQFAQCVFTHKVFEKAVERLEKINFWFRWGSFINFGIVVIFIILPIIWSDKTFLSYIALAIGIFGILFEYLKKVFPIQNEIHEYKKIALQFLILRDKYLNFLADIMNDSIDMHDTIIKRDVLSEQYGFINNIAPQTSDTDYNNAQINLLGRKKEAQEYTWLEEEIDLFLPEELKIKQ